MPEKRSEEIEPPRSLAAYWQYLRRTDMLEAEQVALRRRLLSLQIRTAAVDRKSLLIIESVLPLRAVGLWMPELAELVGGDLVVSRKGEAPSDMTLEEIAQASPDLIIVACTGHGLSQNTIYAKAFTNNIAPVYAVDAVSYFCNADAGLIETAEILAEILHADSRLHFGHKGQYWVQVTA